MIIRTERLNLFPVSNEEMQHIIDNESMPELKEAYREMLCGSLAHPEKREWYAVWNMELNDGSGTVVGDLSFKGLEADGTVEIGYGMKSLFEGRGYMTEAVKAVVQWAAVQDGVKLIEAEAEETNAASIRVLEKCGFVRSGKLGEEGPRFVWKGLK